MGSCQPGPGGCRNRILYSVNLIPIDFHRFFSSFDLITFFFLFSFLSLFLFIFSSLLFFPNYLSQLMYFDCRFFTTHPEYQSKFRAFAKVPIENLKDNRSFLMHAMNVMNSITSIVDTLDNPESLVDDLKQIGLNHRKRPIEAIHFHNLAAVLLAFLQSALGSAFTEQAQKSWNKAMGVIISTILSTLEN